MLCRIDLQAVDRLRWDFAYNTHPRFNEQRGTNWLVDYSAGGRLAHDIGWNEPGADRPIEDNWGWGLAVRIKDFQNGVLKTLVVPRATASKMAGPTFTDGTILYRGQYDRGGIGMRLIYMDRPMGVKPERLTEGGRRKGNGSGQGGTLPPLSQLSDSALQEELERRRAATAPTEQENVANASHPAVPPDRGVKTDGTSATDPQSTTGRDIASATAAVAKLKVRPETLEEHGAKEDQPTLERAART